VTPSGLYRAPLTDGQFHVVAQSRADPTKSATAVITVAKVSVALIPPSAGLNASESLQLMAQVKNAPDQTVDWSVVEDGAAGSVSPGGLYTAPKSAGTFHVIARSRLDPSKFATATLTTRLFVPQAVAYQIGIDHAGHLDFAAPSSFPAAPLWSVTLPGRVSYPLIAGGKVFVNVPGAGPNVVGSTLYALDAATGANAWGPVATPGSFGFANSAYDDAKIYVLNGDASLQQFDAETGAPGFKVGLGFSFDAPPVASKGIVYVSGGSRLFAVLEATGEVLWESFVEAGDVSSPALSDDGVFVAYPGDYYSFSRTTGVQRWLTGQGSEGGGGSTTVYRDGRVYIRDATNLRAGIIVDAATGAQVGTLPSQGVIPAVGDTAAFFLDRGTLEAFDLATETIPWTFTGDGHLSAAPLLVNGTVIAGSGTGAVYALDAATGAVLWTAAAPAPIDAPNEHDLAPRTGMAAGEGLLVVPAGNTLTAWKLQ
jgi:outer membrane protein assembly factor BamB